MFSVCVNRFTMFQFVNSMLLKCIVHFSIHWFLRFHFDKEMKLMKISCRFMFRLMWLTNISLNHSTEIVNIVSALKHSSSTILLSFFSSFVWIHVYLNASSSSSSKGWPKVMFQASDKRSKQTDRIIITVWFTMRNFLQFVTLMCQ